eukprot:CAMPEP_0113954824 /NCGR_PEP_ID=MMETSP0011_2-20120614/863_1 /TAXON_ID=101924 /ORGANISM="Rhodosorus marinus" /LENGTH=2024 /DNA_ID=CAMNT_0000964187 /DNA_START=187 /DNA_END=6261 /DNA_ORIENTATION=- /assembly_acc=CAM_ASM_000156
MTSTDVVRFSKLLRELQDGLQVDTEAWVTLRSNVRPDTNAEHHGQRTSDTHWTGSLSSAYKGMEEFALGDEEWEVAREPRDPDRHTPQEVGSSGEDGSFHLISECKHVTAQLGSWWDPFEMASTILQIVVSGKSDDELQEDLFDALGNFEAAASVFAHRNEIKANAYSIQGEILARETSATLTNSATGGARRSRRNTGFPQPSFQIVDHQSASQKQRQRYNAFRTEEDENEQTEDPAMLEALRHFTAESKVSLDRMALPQGMTRNAQDGYDEYVMPPQLKDKRSKVEPVEVRKILPAELLPAMEGVEMLNPIQSKVWKIALRSSQNMLVCAPTGAGKTNIALMTILREARRFSDPNGRPLTQGWRAVYVAPMKALAAEIVEKFQARLGALDLQVRELTGDVNLSRAEALKTQVVVVTPEKWDVVTRKGGGEGGSSVAEDVSLLIIDEVHLLHEDRGSVLESLVARVQRRSESEQRMIRLVGLSATLPNYRDVAKFLGVGDEGLFFFDSSFRPVPLSQTFIGVEGKNPQKRNEKYLDITFDKLRASLGEGNQCMVFVHSRKDTLATAKDLVERKLLDSGDAKTADEDSSAAPIPTWAKQEITKFRASELRMLASKGVCIHHAGMLRADRKLVERLFLEGVLKVIVCTATLAWGVNLPAHTVIIKGTQIYDAKRGGFVELSMLDVMQIFGRAGRPQFDIFGEGTIITSSEQLPHYLRFLTSSLPIESRLQQGGLLPDHLNAEVVLGTVSSVAEAVQWLGYTYMAVRMKRNPLHYGCRWDEVVTDPELVQARRTLILEAARALNSARMIRFDEKSEELAPTELGRVASHFYVSHGTISSWNENLHGDSKESDVLLAVANASEFEQVRPREEEMEELTSLVRHACEVSVSAGLDTYAGKVVTLLQAYISRAPIRSFSLVSDQNYVAQSAARLMRALFETAVRKGWPSVALLALELSRAIDRQLWPFSHPLAQFSDDRRRPEYVPPETCNQLARLGPAGDVESLLECTHGELISVVGSAKVAAQVRRALRCIPVLYVNADVVPVTRSVLRINVDLWPGFAWSDSVHGKEVQLWRLWVEDTEHARIYHTERISLSRRQCQDLSELNPMSLELMVPVFDPPSSHYVVSVESERWHGAGTAVTLSLAGVTLPQQHPISTDLLDLRPLPKTALGPDPAVLSLYSFEYFNALQTQMFWTLYHTDNNVLVGAPTGSGKTVTAELAALRAFRVRPKDLVVYVAPLKALVRERVKDWKNRLSRKLGKRVVELTGDAQSSASELGKADIVVTTPEKWDGVTRGWRQRAYVSRVSLLIIDEVHLLGSERGAVLEVIISRARRLDTAVRIVALSTALANPGELGDWIGVRPGESLFNFRPSVRPVPCEVHIQGVSGDHYCPRMMSMNRPTYAAILRYSPDKPCLIFVSSRRQTRLTAMDLIKFAAADGSPRRFLAQGRSENESTLEGILPLVKDESLRHTLEFGVGMHHAGLVESDRAAVEALFASAEIQVLISTSTLAWGVNLPAHLVVLKGTEFFDAKQHRYVDMPLTDVLQMIGRAGRPQFDDRAFAVLLVHEPRKGFYKKFLYEAFPVESSLPAQLADHINAEIASESIRTTQDAMDYLTWTYFFRRLLMNPSFYGLEKPSASSVSAFLSNLVETVLHKLVAAGCIAVVEPVSVLEEAHKVRSLEPGVASKHSSIVQEMHVANPEHSRSRAVAETFLLRPLPLGHIAAYYYLSHRTMRHFSERLSRSIGDGALLKLLADAEEFAEVPVRHNEDRLAEELWRDLYQNFIDIDAPAEELLPTSPPPDWNSPHVKTRLLLVAQISRLPLPTVDYGTNIVQDNMYRVLQGMMDVAAESGMLHTTLRCVHLGQQLTQSEWASESPLPLGFVNRSHRDRVRRAFLNIGIGCVPELLFYTAAELEEKLHKWKIPRDSIDQVMRFRRQISIPTVKARLHEDGRGLAVSVSFPSRKETTVKDSWYLVLGDPLADELYAIKRLPRKLDRGVQPTQLLLSGRSENIASLRLYIMSDTFIGIDQELTI